MNLPTAHSSHKSTTDSLLPEPMTHPSTWWILRSFTTKALQLGIHTFTAVQNTVTAIAVR